MNPVTRGDGEMIATDAMASASGMFNSAGSAKAPMQHAPQLPQDVPL